MFKIKDPRTGEDAWVSDHVGYRTDMAAARPAPCTHEAIDVRRWTNVNGAVVVQAQCLTCGTRQGNQLKVTDRNAYPVADLDLVSMWEARDRAAIESVQARHIDLTAQALAGEADLYETHIASDAWKRTRAKVLKRCGGVCEGCAEAPVVEVHHLTYDHLGDELLYELVGLCADCHKKAHRGWHERTTPEPAPDEVTEIDF